MTTIYREAKQVVACLGQGHDEGSLLNFLGELDVHIVIELAERTLPGLGRAKNFPFPEEPEKWRRLQSLLEADFWTRAWIIQEIVVARQVKILHDRRFIPWDMFSRVISCFRSANERGQLTLARMNMGPDRFKACRYGIHFIPRLRSLRQTYRRGRMSNIPLPNVLVECCQSESGDPLDKVYALQGLDKTYGMAKELEPKYGIDALDRYAEVTKYFLRKGSFSLLGLAGLDRKNEASQQKRRSWVPLLSALSDDHLYPLDNPSTTYRAGGTVLAEVKDTDRPHDDPYQGHLAGRDLHGRPWKSVAKHTRAAPAHARSRCERPAG